MSIDTPLVEVSNIVKTFVNRTVVKDLSFSLRRGEIFGLIGPNGAGKTTTLRMMMDIIKPDSGTVTILGEKLNEASKNRLGYLPEERGMYRKQTVMDTIIYLASLKNVDRTSAEKEANLLLNQTGMFAHRYKKIDELSKGMGQIIQFIVTIVHKPELVVLDEPFSGLDPVNAELLKEKIIELRSQGKAVVLSTHQMNQVEELCDRILMVNSGRAVLYGRLNEIKSKYKSHAVLLNYEGDLSPVQGIIESHHHRDYVELILDENTTPHMLLVRLVNQGVVINHFEISTPSLNEIFLDVAGSPNE